MNARKTILPIIIVILVLMSIITAATVIYVMDKNNGNIIEGNADDSDNSDGEIGSIAIVLPDYKTSFVYDNTEHFIGLISTDKYTISGDSRATNAGEYTAIAYINDKNLNSWAEGSNKDIVIKWRIEKSRYNSEVLTFEDADIVANGEKHSLVVGGKVPADVKISYVGNNVSGVGTHIVQANFIYDKNNYTEIMPRKATLTIRLGVFDMSVIKVPPIEGQYKVVEGEAVFYSASLIGVLPEGVTVDFENNRHNQAGEYEVIVNFTHYNKYYEKIPQMTSTITVSKGVYEMANYYFEDKTVIYDGSFYSLNLVSDDFPEGFVVEWSENSFNNVGEYLVSVTITNVSNTNYEDIEIVLKAILTIANK